MLRKDPFITGEYYHIYNRGIDKRIIFKFKADFERFIMLLYVANSEESLRLDNLINNQNKKYEDILVIKKKKQLVSIGAWCIMPNHFHVLIKQETDGGITQFMKKLGTGYAMYFNIKYQRQGALFGGLFKSKLIGTDDAYMQHLFGYIHLNPLDTKFFSWEENVNRPTKEMKIFLEFYPYSSYLDYLKKRRVENSLLNIEAFPEYFSERFSLKDFVESYLQLTT